MTTPDHYDDGDHNKSTMAAEFERRAARDVTTIAWTRILKRGRSLAENDGITS